MSKIVYILGGPFEDFSGQYYNDCIVLDDYGNYDEESIYYDSEDEAQEDLDLIEYGPIDLEYEWYDGDEE